MNGRTICIEFFFCLFQILASAGCAAVTERDDLGGLGVIPQQAFWWVENPPKSQTCTCLHCLPPILSQILINKFQIFFSDSNRNSVTNSAASQMMPSPINPRKMRTVLTIISQLTVFTSVMFPRKCAVIYHNKVHVMKNGERMV